MAKATLRAKKPAKIDVPADWFVTGQAPQKYEGGSDPDMAHEGKPCFFLRRKDGADLTNVWATLMTSTDAPGYIGKRVRLSMWVKTESAGWVAPWMRVDSNDKRITAFDNFCARHIRGSADWQMLSIVLDVAEGSAKIAYGFILGGAGKVWVHSPTLEEVGAEVKPSDCACMKSKAIKTKKSSVKALILRTPKGWTDRIVRGNSAKYDVGVDQSEKFKGKNAACVNVRDAGEYESVDLYQTMGCNGFKGKRIRLTVQLKTLKVTAGVFFIEILGPHAGTIAVDDMANRPLSGTHDWSEHSIVMDVPDGAYEMNFGARVTGGGTMWFSGLVLEEVDTTVPVTDDYSTGCRGIWWSEVVNTDFSVEEESRYSYQSCQQGRPAKGWLGWSVPGDMFEVGIDSTVRHHDKNSGCIKKLAKGHSTDLAWLFQKFDGKLYRGKRVRLTAYVKTDDIVGDCGLVLVVMDSKQECLFAENTFDVDSEPSHDWLKREIVLDVPTHAGVLMISLEVLGGGSAWINDVAFEVVDKDVPLTFSSWKASPKNLDLTEVF